jgi:peptidylprolyl isomerase
MDKVEPGARVLVNYIGWLDDNSVFDSSILGWKDLALTPDSNLDDFETKPMPFVVGKRMLIPGFESRIQGMKAGEMKTIAVPPEEAYGTDPAKHPLGGKTLHFKIRIESVE